MVTTGSHNMSWCSPGSATSVVGPCSQGAKPSKGTAGRTALQGFLRVILVAGAGSWVVGRAASLSDGRTVEAATTEMAGVIGEKIELGRVAVLGGAGVIAEPPQVSRQIDLVFQRRPKLEVQGLEVTQAIQHYRASEHLTDPADLRAFNTGGYGFRADMSDAARLVFLRSAQDAEAA